MLHWLEELMCKRRYSVKHGMLVRGSALSLTKSAMLAVACAEKGRYFMKRILGNLLQKES